MSCLSERERIALEDIFLSISANQSPFERYKDYSPNLRDKAKRALGFIQSVRMLKSYRHSKLFFRQKKQQIRKNLGFLRHQ